ncbi:NAD(P)H-dependent oxidoreductase subunit E [Candidatus Latescibacterota bacterium]
MTEFVTPILVLSSISLFLGVLLVLSDKYFGDYGECKVTITDETEFVVNGGQTLLTYLIANNFSIPSSCGGKSTCGYCKVKVLSDSGPMLPTERPFMTREDRENGIRLACQVKVKSDMEIKMPDFLETVRNVVANELYNPNLRWRFNLASQDNIIPGDRKISKIDLSEDYTVLQGILENTHDNGDGDGEGVLVPVLQNVHNAFNYLPEHGIQYVSEELKIPISKVYRVATFYNAFSFKPRGKNIIKVCMGTSCYVKGAGKILDTIETELGVNVGNCTEDMKYTLETVNCIGCCGQSPVLSVNEDIYGYLNNNMLYDIIDKY